MEELKGIVILESPETTEDYYPENHEFNKKLLELEAGTYLIEGETMYSIIRVRYSDLLRHKVKNHKEYVRIVVPKATLDIFSEISFITSLSHHCTCFLSQEVAKAEEYANYVKQNTVTLVN